MKGTYDSVCRRAIWRAISASAHRACLCSDLISDLISATPPNPFSFPFPFLTDIAALSRQPPSTGKPPSAVIQPTSHLPLDDDHYELAYRHTMGKLSLMSRGREAVEHNNLRRPLRPTGGVHEPPPGSGSQMTLMGRIPSDPGWYACSRCMGGGGRRKSRNKDRYRTSGVRWCRVVDMACPATLQLSADTGTAWQGSMGRPSRKGLSHGRGSVTWASTLEPDADLLEVPKEELIRGLAVQRRRENESTGSRAPHSPVGGWSLALETLHRHKPQL
ncbi:hypothetical protein TIFTF001_002590 [Ficus carica]|uniref:Uncharacterized protein n=1 Tax=Ficus carica TaxID=3494 RepID=A0AA87ZNF5_FICCA|nr:hypothetical protein TIFTF001_002590 [Ficus carica]